MWACGAVAESAVSAHAFLFRAEQFESRELSLKKERIPDRWSFCSRACGRPLLRFYALDLEQTLFRAVSHTT